jgi:hypothetical protein
MKGKRMKEDFIFEIYNEEKITSPPYYLYLGQNINEHLKTFYFLDNQSLDNL